MTSLRGAVCLATLVMLAGCATVSVESQVASDGTIQQYEVDAELTQQAFERLQSRAESEGYDDVEGFVRGQFNESRYRNLNYDQSRAGSNVTITVTISGYDPGPDSDIRINATGENITYEERVPREFSEAQVEYAVTMPGEILETNAEEVSGNNRTARWTFSSGEAGGQQLTVESRKESGVAALLPTIRLADAATIGSLLFMIGYVIYIRSDRSNGFEA